MSLPPEARHEGDGASTRRAEAVRLIVTRRERAPRSPRMERAFKRLIWRYLAPDSGQPGEQKNPSPPAREEGERGESEC